MSEVYHYDCRPNVADDQFRTLRSKFESECSVNCGQPIAIGDKIAFFGERLNRTNQPAAAVDPKLLSDVRELMRIVPVIRDTAFNAITPQQFRELNDRIAALDVRLANLESCLEPAL